MAVEIPAIERRERIRELLKEGKPLTVATLSSLFRASEMTVRRDLAQLEAEGRLHRTRGGAEPIRTEEYEPSFNIRARENAREKLAIGKAAANLVKDGEVIIVDIGTTFLQFLRITGQARQFTVLTNWLPNVLELAKYPNVHTIVLGGALRKAELSLVGGMTKDALAGFNADKAFIGIGGLTIDKGITDYNMEEVEVKRAMIRTAREVFVLADHSKLERLAPICIAPLNAVHALVTDFAVTEHQCQILRSSGLNVIVAPAG